MPVYRFPIERTVREVRPSCTSFGDCDVVDLRGHPLADVPCDVTPDRTLIEEWSESDG